MLLPPIDIPSFTGLTFKAFLLKSRLASRTQGRYGIGLDYLMRMPNGPYNGIYPSREDKLRQCVCLTVANFTVDIISLQSLFVEHINNDGLGSNIINRLKNIKNPK